MCHCSKETYQSKAEAVAAIPAISKREGKGVYAYPCPEGDGFHLATKGKKRHMKNIRATLEKCRYKGDAQRPLTIKKKYQEPVYNTEKLLTKDQARHLKQLIEGNNAVEKQINKP